MKIDNKQKVLITLIVIALAYVLWQVYNQFFREPSTPTVVTTPVARPTATTTTTTQQPAATTSETAAQPVAAPTLQSIQTAPKNAIPGETGFTLEAPMNEYQSQYLELVNQYQLLRMRRMIVEEEAGIASARQRIETIDQKLGSAGSTPTSADISGGGDVNNPTGYKLMYIDFQGGQWSATLGKDNRFLEVNSDEVLMDGTRVLNINQQGVVIEQNQAQYLLTFYGTKSLGQAKPIQVDETLAPNNLFIPSSKGKHKMSTITPPLSVKASLAPPAEKSTTTKIVTPIIKKGSTTPTMSPTIPVIPEGAVPKSKITTSPTTVPAIPKTVAPNSQKPVILAPQQNKPSSSVPAIPGAMNTIKIPLKAPETASVTIPMRLAETAKPDPTATIVPSAALQLTGEQKNTDNALQTILNNQQQPVTAESPEKLQQAIAPNNSSLSFAQDEKYLLTIPGNYYVVQIMGSRNQDDLMRLLRQYHLNEQARGFQTYRLDHSWYVLVYGVYKNSQDATTALAQLPSGIQQLKPWVRSVASIHDAIHSGRDKPVKQVTRRQVNPGQGQGISI
jgi:septal ring-binding cell division protein DamX